MAKKLKTLKPVPKESHLDGWIRVLDKSIARSKKREEDNEKALRTHWKKVKLADLSSKDLLAYYDNPTGSLFLYGPKIEAYVHSVKARLRKEIFTRIRLHDEVIRSN